ncbi:CDC48 family AAA ATPase [Candidatus Woesearchaeota archaeon]|nr:CDC48 family AAA ATPase [Candidatus Woesearchaeota archaeon]
MTGNDLRLRVAEAVQDDVNKGIVRVDSTYMHEAGINTGDIVEIEGSRKTVAIVDRALPNDIGSNIIRMDGLMRRNAETSIGDVVAIRKADVKEATKVVIAPAKQGVFVKASPIIIHKGLLRRAVRVGDIVSIGGVTRRRNTTSQNPFFDDVMNVFEESMIFGLGDLKFIVAEALPKGAVIISENTEVIFNPQAIDVKEEQLFDVTYEDVGGLKEEVRKIREMVELPLKHPEIFERLGIEPPKGVLLHGPPGTGKTLLAKAVANETNSNFIVINGPEIMSKFYGESEANLRKKFEEAEKNAPSIIFIDEIDAIASKREESKGEVERRVVAQLLTIMDGLKSRGKVVVIAATNIPNSIDPALRRPGRFDRELEISVPNIEGRLNILKIHTRGMPLYSANDCIAESSISEDKKALLYKLATFIENKNDFNELDIVSAVKKLKESNADADEKELLELSRVLLDNTKIVNLSSIAHKTHGFVGADLAALAKEAAMNVLRKVLPDLNLDNDDEELPDEVLKKLQISQEDFFESMKTVRPSALREVFIEVPNVNWKDIGGLEDLKQELKEAVEWPIKHPESFTRLGVRPPRGILLYGPPGTGKTLLAKAVATESDANFISVKGPELLSKWVGESEKAIRKIFQKARQTSPTVIFFDEIDSIAPRRNNNENNSRVTETVVNQMLTEMDGLEDMNKVVVIAATNRPDIMDTALLRPGRFDRIILAGVPDFETRLKIFDIHTKKMALAKDVNINELADNTDGYVGADIESICREAAIMALRDDINVKDVKMKYFEKALEKVKPSVSKDIEKAYEELQDKFRQARGAEMKDNKPSYYG